MKDIAIENIKTIIKDTYNMSDNHKELAEIIYNLVSDSYDSGYEMGFNTAKENIQRIIIEELFN